jgi:phosphohistidine phosphatase SixA
MCCWPLIAKPSDILQEFAESTARLEAPGVTDCQFGYSSVQHANNVRVKARGTALMRSRLDCSMANTIPFALLIAFMLVGDTAGAADDTALAWATLRGDGHVALIRHAPAPGPVGDPFDYKLDDCTTQRNLSEQGRAEAQALGARFRMQQVKVGKVVSSQWCRCKQTAELMNIGPVEDAPTFNNAFVLNAMRDELTTGARTMIDAWRGPGTLVVVTHGENILLMLGLRPREAEVIVVTPDPTSQKKMRLIGRIGPP